MPAKMARDVNREVKEGKFASTSEFFRHLLRLWNTEKLARDVAISRRQFAKGNYKILKSMKDLD